jgi:GNAT superfamily N-acetyltransferase
MYNSASFEFSDAQLPSAISHPVLKFVVYAHSDIIFHPEITEPIIDLINAAFRIHVRFRDPRLEGHDQLCQELSENGSFLFALYSGDLPVATGGIQRSLVPGACKLLLFATRPSSSRAGYGSLLLSHSESLAYEKGYRKITMEVVKEHAGVLPFYTKRGYTIVREVKRPDETGDWRECQSWGPKAPFTLCELEKLLGAA